jgi:hypothetical protein
MLLKTLHHIYLVDFASSLSCRMALSQIPHHHINTSSKPLDTSISWPNMAPRGELLSLPDEVLLQILVETPSIPEENQRTLKNIALTCRGFHPIAREALLATPCVRMNLINDLLDLYRKYPTFAMKPTTLEIRAADVDTCTCGFQAGRAAVAIIIGFKALMQLLPNVHTLLLGANRLKDIPAFHFLFLEKGKIFCSHHSTTFPDQPNPISALPDSFYPDLSGQLKTLELPAEWAQTWNGREKKYHNVYMVWNLNNMASLTHITVPDRALASLWQVTGTAYLPPTLEKLTVSHVHANEISPLLKQLLDNICESRRQDTPNLRRIDVWTHGCGQATCHLSDTFYVMKVKETFGTRGVDLHLLGDRGPSTWQKRLLRERSGRKTGHAQFHGLEARECFEKWRIKEERERVKLQIKDEANEQAVDIIWFESDRCRTEIMGAITWMADLQLEEALERAMTAVWPETSSDGEEFEKESDEEDSEGQEVMLTWDLDKE